LAQFMKLDKITGHIIPKFDMASRAALKMAYD
jgi:hypothetical protein